MGEDECTLREQVNRDVVSDAVEVEAHGDETTVCLYYLEPQCQVEPVRVGENVALAVVNPEVDAVIAEMMDSVTRVTTPDEMSVEDCDGYYVIELTFEEGNSW